MRIYFGPTNDVLITDDLDAPLYRGTCEEFVDESGCACPVLPQGRVAMEYRPLEGVVAYFDRKQTSYPQPGRVAMAELDAVLEKSADLQTAQAVREAHDLALVMDRVFNANARAMSAPPPIGAEPVNPVRSVVTLI